MLRHHISSPRRLPASSEKIFRDLEELNRLSEAEFLSIGERLQGLSQRARKIASQCGEAAACVSGPEFDGAIEKLRRMLEYAQGFKREGATDQKILNTLIERVRESRRLMAAFPQLVMTLKIVALQTRIESAHLQAEGTDFTSVSEQVERLAAEIDSRSSNILTGTLEVEAFGRRTLAQLARLDSHQRIEASELASRTRSSLEAFTQHHGRAIECARQVAERYQKVHQAISEIVRSLQFQDISRQQIEHVQEALREMSGKLNGHAEAPGVAAHLGELQAAQLRNTRDSLIAAVERVREGIHLIAEEIGCICALPLELEKPGQGGSFLEDARDKLLGVAQGMKSVAGSVAEVAGVVSRMAQAIERISGFASEVEDIGFRIRMIALNASVKTVHMGERGATLGTLAGKIQELASSTFAATASVAEQLRFLKKQAQEMAGNSNGAEAAEPVRALESMAHEMEQGVETLRALHERANRRLAATTASGCSLRDEVETVRAAIQLDGKAREIFGRVLESLDESLADLRARSGPGLDHHILGHLRRHEARYTMQAEREVHGGVLEAVMEAPGEEKQGEFGSNVELF